MEPKMNQSESEGQSCTLTAVLRDLSVPAEHDDVFLDQRTNTTKEGGTNQHPLASEYL